MKLTTDTTSLRAAVDWAARHIPARAVAPILAAAVLETTDDGLTVSGFDYDTWGECTLDAQVSEPGRVAVSGRLLRSVADALAKGGRVDLIAEQGTTLQVRAGELRASLPLMPVEDYPARPAMPGAGILLPPELARLLAWAVPVAADMEGDTPNACGCELVLDPDGVTVAAVDRYRLWSSRLPWPAESGRVTEPASVLLTAPSVRAFAEATKGAARTVLGLPGDGEHVVSVTADGRTVGLRQSGHAVPAWRKLQQQPEPTRSLVVTAAELIDLVKRMLPMALLTDKKHRQLGLDVGGGLLRVSAELDGTVADAIPVQHTPEWDAEPWPTRINGPFLIGVLEAADAEEVRIDLTGPSKAWKVTRPGSDLFAAVFMPVRLAAGATR